MSNWLGGSASVGFQSKCRPHLASTAPARKRADIPEHLPSQVSEEFSEAEECFLNPKMKRSAARAYRASIEAALKEKNAQGGTIFKKIEHLHKTGLLTTTLRDFADAVRILGNDAAHGDPLSDDEVSDLDTRINLAVIGVS